MARLRTRDLLADLDLLEYVGVLAEHRFDFVSDFAGMDRVMLRELGMPLGHANRLLVAAQAVNFPPAVGVPLPVPETPPPPPPPPGKEAAEMPPRSPPAAARSRTPLSPPRRGRCPQRWREVGARVDAHFHGEWHPARIVELHANGDVEVSWIVDNSRTLVTTAEVRPHKILRSLSEPPAETRAAVRASVRRVVVSSPAVSAAGSSAAVSPRSAAGSQPPPSPAGPAPTPTPPRDVAPAAAAPTPVPPPVTSTPVRIARVVRRRRGSLPSASVRRDGSAATSRSARTARHLPPPATPGKGKGKGRADEPPAVRRHFSAALYLFDEGDYDWNGKGAAEIVSSGGVVVVLVGGDTVVRMGVREAAAPVHDLQSPPPGQVTWRGVNTAHDHRPCEVVSLLFGSDADAAAFSRSLHP
eukprot:TRINITY_DN7471_c1_g6_i1.p1 TRINITY_DN7471_c1_g6~~TRINITY_DN7471_c1_g6_i1.p1  ORF type:complete len:413 (+),score=130.23 TRINITY_DN7471_c1_g6_i1:155-1393(+)